MANNPQPPPPTAAQTQNGLALARGILAQFGLPDSLLQFLSNAAITGSTPDELTAMLYETPEFKARFPAIAIRRDKGLPALTPTEYVTYEQTAAQAFRRFNLPLPVAGQGFNQIITELLGNNVGAEELVNDRLTKAWSELEKAPPDVRAAAEQAFGIHGDKVLAGMILDPDKSAPEIQRLADSMMILGTGNAYGFNFTAQRASQLGYTDAASHLQDFQKLSELTPLFRQNVGETQNEAITAEGVGAGAIFNEPGQAASQLNRALEQRKADLSGGAGQVVATQGVVGLKTADRNTDR